MMVTIEDTPLDKVTRIEWALVKIADQLTLIFWVLTAILGTLIGRMFI